MSETPNSQPATPASALLTELAFTLQCIEVLAPWAHAGASYHQVGDDTELAAAASNALQLLDYLGAPSDLHAAYQEDDQ
jgi:hypothetical protein